MKRTLIITALSVAFIICATLIWYFAFREKTNQEIPYDVSGSLPVSDALAPSDVGDPSIGVLVQPISEAQDSQSGSFSSTWFFGVQGVGAPTPSEPVPDQGVAFTPAEIKNEIRSDFEKYIRTISDTVLPTKTTVVSDYALQEWSDENVGGVSVMKTYATEVNWVVLASSGGTPTAAWLVSMGVPESIAQKLIQDGGY